MNEKSRNQMGKFFKVFPSVACKVKFTQTQMHKSLNASLEFSVTGRVEVINNWKISPSKVTQKSYQASIIQLAF